MGPIQERTQPHVEGVWVVRKEHGAMNDGGLQASGSVGEQRVGQRHCLYRLPFCLQLTPIGPWPVTHWSHEGHLHVGRTSDSFPILILSDLSATPHTDD